jgi:hypothetical protein
MIGTFNIIKITTLIIVIFLLSFSTIQADSRFSSTYSCSDASKYCVSKGTRTVEGFTVTPDCWQWAYSKTCNYPSKNNCQIYGHCYLVANKDCLLKDSLGSCVNLQKEFSCKRWESENKPNQTARMGFEDKEGQEGLVCKSIPCIDGNCVDKSYMTNGEMMDSLSKLHATSNMKPDAEGHFKLFEGFGSHCSKKPIGYSNCCQVKAKGWGKELGMKCSKDEQDLAERRLKNLCISVGHSKTKNLGVTTVTKHHFCCFGNMLEKVVQVEGRKQLGINFGSGGDTNCRGLTLEEIQKLDFSKMDFSEFVDELLLKFAGKYKAPDQKEIASRIKNSMGDIRKYDNDPSNQDNNMTGWSGAIKDDSREADEERRLEAERLEQTKQKQVILQQEKIRKKQEQINNKKKELQVAIKKSEDARFYWNNYGHNNPNKDTGYSGQPYSWNAAEWNKVVGAGNEVERIKKELEALK